MKRSLIVLICAGLFKILPLIQGLIIVALAGTAYYATIGYYQISTIFISSSLAAGLAPAYVREVARPDSDPAQLRALLRGTAAVCTTIMAAYVILTVIGFFGDASGVVALTLGLATGINAALIPVLFVISRPAPLIIATLAFFVLTVGVASLSGVLSLGVFQYVLMIPPVLLAVVLLRRFLRLNRPYIANAPAERWSLSVCRALGKVAPIFVPNVTWMAAIFYFCHRVRETEASADLFPWFAIGLQGFAIFVFIPNSLGPLILARLSRLDPAASIRQSFVLTGLFLGVSCAVYMVLLLGLGLFAPVGLPNGVADLLALVAAGGVFASMNGPIMNSLVRHDRAYLIGLAVAAWTGVAHLGFSLSPANFGTVFLYAHISAALCFLVIAFWLARKTLKPSTAPDSL